VKLLAGDVGGTSTRLRLEDATTREVLAGRTFSSEDHESLESILVEFLGSEGDVAVACIAIAGPVVDGAARLTNLPWRVSERSIESRTGIARAIVVNDFRALATSIPHLSPDDLVEVNAGERDPSSPVVVLGAGTGLGEAILLPDSPGHRVLPTEGGHCDFGPADAEQTELLGWLARRYGHVSWERILSGEGLSEVHAFFRERAGEQGTEDRLDPAEVARRAGEGDEIAAKAAALFIDAFGAEAGNFALKTLSRGGVYIGGGIAAKNVEWFTDGRFVRAFTAKGRFADLMRSIPVDLIRAQDAGLRGAMAIARDSASVQSDLK